MSRNIETKAEAEEWIEAIERGSRGLVALSQGACPGGEEELVHLDVCTDCAFYLANGPDDRISDLLAS